MAWIYSLDHVFQVLKFALVPFSGLAITNQLSLLILSCPSFMCKEECYLWPLSVLKQYALLPSFLARHDRWWSHLHCPSS